MQKESGRHKDACFALTFSWHAVRCSMYVSNEMSKGPNVLGFQFQITWASWLKEKQFIWDHSFRGLSPWPLGPLFLSSLWCRIFHSRTMWRGELFISWWIGNRRAAKNQGEDTLLDLPLMAYFFQTQNATTSWWPRPQPLSLAGTHPNLNGERTRKAFLAWEREMMGNLPSSILRTNFLPPIN